MSRRKIQNENDAKYAHVINVSTILVDFRNLRTQPHTQAQQVRALANRHFWGTSSGIVRDVDERTGDTGTFLGNNLTQVYHIESVSKGIWIASTGILSPDQTRPIARQYLSPK